MHTRLFLLFCTVWLAPQAGSAAAADAAFDPRSISLPAGF